jgi:endonuclease/exonuclease/phosphatase family metal-dependent hydrolase
VTGILVYCPVQIWLLPFGILIPICIFFHPRLALCHLIAVLFILFGYMTFRWSAWPAPTRTTLTVLTNNVGQNNRQSLQPFIREQNPDVIALQDAAGRVKGYTKEYPDRFVASRGEFVLISKFRIVSADILPSLAWNGRPVAARFELSIDGASLAVYSVHMPTPRSDFMKLRGSGLVRRLLGKDWNRSKPDSRSFSESMGERVNLTRDLVTRIVEEKHPYLVMGDFNMPDHGYDYHLVTSKLTDAFAKSGHGWGFTFPGDSRHFGPWLRLDYLFAGAGWRAVACFTEPERTSQHRAVTARFEPAASK